MRLLASDLDGTLLGDAEALGRLTETLESHRDGMRVAYVTGRSTVSALEILESERLPRPDYLVTSLGGCILTSSVWRADRDWAQHLDRDWSEERVRAVAAYFDKLSPQPARHQDRFKCSFALAPEDAAGTLASLGLALRRHRIPARCIYSSGRDLDIVPELSGKGNAVRYLSRRLGLGPTAVLTCGDSGNDLDMLTMGFLAATPGNALAEVRNLAGEAIYHARGSYAHGVREALEHFGWLEGR